MPNTDTSRENRIVRWTVWGSVVVIGIFSFWGAWTRRWIADDGLIVLRTVRNLIAGNGPVFNAGERVEANTSTLWQYLIYAVQRITRGDLEHIVMWLALLLSVAAMTAAVWATSRVFAGRAVVPAGALVYLALPPARDFFTSGLEWGLAIFYLAFLWWLLIEWARGERNALVYVLAFWAGLSWLVRPELALYGGITGIVLLATHRHWRAWLGILGAALPVPAAYELFRMGYYGLLTPHTAVAKSAADSAWGQGWAYLMDFVGPYWLWLPVLVALIVGYFAYRGGVLRGRRVAAVAIMVGCAALHTLYVLRVGGDFMHGRMLLLPLFAALLPVFVVPLKAVGASASAAVLGIWAFTVVLRGHPVDWAYFEDGEISIVDEREFWTYANRLERGDAPKGIADYADNKLLGGFDKGIKGLEDGDALAMRYLENEDPETYSWLPVERETGRTDPPTLYLVNMGMSSARSPLDVRVLDNIGLATPLAARQPRLPDGRIGHDKLLSREWQAADSGVDIDALPSWIDKDEVRKARRALQTEDFQKLFATYRDPLTFDRFMANIKWALTDGRTLQLSSNPDDYLGS